jgi:hypothetical protein
VDLTGGNPRLGIKIVHACHLFVDDNGEVVVHYSVEKVKCTPLIDQYIIVALTSFHPQLMVTTEHTSRQILMFEALNCLTRYNSHQGYDR